MRTRHFARPHIGKVPMKFYFRAQDISLSLPGLDVQGKLVLLWKRGYRRTATEPFEVKEELSPVDGSLSRSASTMQDLAQICTMFKNSRSGSFESKVSSFILKEESASGEERRLGSATIDLASYATPDISSDRVELSFCEGKAVLRLNLSSHWLKSVNAVDDDTESTASFDSDYSCNASTRAPGTAAPTSNVSARLSGSAVTPLGLQQFTVMDADQRALTSRRREEAIEERWAEEERRGCGAQEAEALADQVARLGDELSRSRCEGTYLRERLTRLQAENRVLRRDPRAGRREDLVLQLEVELQTKEMERADMEEELSSAFGGVIKELQARVAGLAAERDRLLASVEELKGGWSRGFKTAR